MTFSIEDIILSQEIFYYLLQHHELREQDMQELYRAYIENTAVQTLLMSQCENAACTITHFSDTLYLVPREDNRFLGYSRADLRREMCKSEAKTVDFYLAQFAVLVLLLEFYDGQGQTSKIRDYIRIGELQNSISEHLKEGAALLDEEMQQEEGIAFTGMLHAYESLSPEKSERHTKKNTKDSFLFKILRFLENQGLIQVLDKDDMIKTTRKLDQFMDWSLLNQDNYHHLLSVIGAPVTSNNGSST